MRRIIAHLNDVLDDGASLVFGGGAYDASIGMFERETDGCVSVCFQSASLERFSKKLSGAWDPVMYPFMVRVMWDGSAFHVHRFLSVGHQTRAVLVMISMKKTWEKNWGRVWDDWANGCYESKMAGLKVFRVFKAFHNTFMRNLFAL